jgi:hypothetical protein
MSSVYVYKDSAGREHIFRSPLTGEDAQGYRLVSAPTYDAYGSLADRYGNTQFAANPIGPAPSTTSAPSGSTSPAAPSGASGGMVNTRSGPFTSGYSSSQTKVTPVDPSKYPYSGIDRSAIQDVGEFGFLSRDINDYMSPYTQQVVDTTLAELQRQREITQLQNQDAAQKAGAFGGSRHGVLEAETNRGFFDIMGQQTAQLRDAAYRQGAELLQSDLNRAMEANKLNQGMDWNVASFNATQSYERSRDLLLDALATVREATAHGRMTELEAMRQTSGLLAQFIQSVGAINQADMSVEDKQRQIEALRQMTFSTIGSIGSMSGQANLVNWAGQQAGAITAAAGGGTSSGSGTLAGQVSGAVGGSTSGGGTASAYLSRYPDVRNAYNNASSAERQWIASRGYPSTVEGFAKWHYDTYGKSEGRIW